VWCVLGLEAPVGADKQSGVCRDDGIVDLFHHACLSVNTGPQALCELGLDKAGVGRDAFLVYRAERNLHGIDKIREETLLL
jgi:hypothetical protein